MPRYAATLDDLVSPEDLRNHSGLELLQSIADGRRPQPPIARIMSMALVEAEEGRVVFEADPAFTHYNPMGGVHGGWFGTLLDSCLGCAVQSRLPKGVAYTTLEYRVNITRPLAEGGERIRAIGEALHVGKRTGTAEGKLIGAESGKLYAFGTTTCLIIEVG